MRLDDGSTGGGLSYARFEWFNWWDLGIFQLVLDYSQKFRTENALSLNIHGPYFSGKTAILDGLNSTFDFFNRTRLITVYPEFVGLEGASHFLAELQKRNIENNKLICIDGADKLSPEALAKLREQYKKLACTSLNRMGGFEHYFDTATLLK